MRNTLLFFMFFPLFIHAQWVQMGSDIDGQFAQENFGWCISLSGDGQIMAVGAPGYDLNGYNDIGLVRAYSFNGSNWVQLGQDITGDIAGDYLGGSIQSEGTAISLNFDGSILAVGAHKSDANGTDSGVVRIYENVSGNWVQVGLDIPGETSDEWSGFSIDLNASGDMVAVGAPLNSQNGSGRGQVRTYEYKTGNWTQKGGDVIGDADFDNLGWAVSLSDTGDVLAVGARRNDDNGIDAGKVKIFSFSEATNKQITANKMAAGTWTQIGSAIVGENAGDFSGAALSLSGDGNTIAIGAKYNNGNGTSSGHTRVFQNVSNVWTQIGSDIDSEAQGDEAGYSVSINVDGTKLAIGARINDGNGNASGQVRVFENISNNWVQIHSDIDGESLGSEAGWAVSLSADGSKLAMGTPRNSQTALDAGHARVYSDGTLGINDILLDDALTLYPNPTKDYFQIKMKEPIDAISIYNLEGKMIKSFSSFNGQITINDLTKGIYLVKINIAQKSVLRKLVVD